MSYSEENGQVVLRMSREERCPTCGSNSPKQLAGDCLGRLRQCLGLSDGRKFYPPANLWHRSGQSFR